MSSSGYRRKIDNNGRKKEAAKRTDEKEKVLKERFFFLSLQDGLMRLFVPGFLNNVATAMWLGARYVPGYHGWFFTGRNERKRLRRVCITFLVAIFQ